VGGLVAATQPAVNEQLVREAAVLGNCDVWMQQGSESPTAIQFLQEHGMNVAAGECILTYHPTLHSPRNFRNPSKRPLAESPNEEGRMPE
jgi:hypothetical protein